MHTTEYGRGGSTLGESYNMTSKEIVYELKEVKTKSHRNAIGSNDEPHSIDTLYLNISEQ